VTDLDDLLNLPRPKWVYREIAVLGGPLEDDLTIAWGYLEAAEITALLDRARAGRRPAHTDPLPVPAQHRTLAEVADPGGRPLRDPRRVHGA
jgi:hypothetical protein